jgi:hypothetical protein
MMDIMEISAASGDIAIARTQPLTVILAESDELLAHQAYLEALSKAGKCLWDQSVDEVTTGKPDFGI